MFTAIVLFIIAAAIFNQIGKASPNMSDKAQMTWSLSITLVLWIAFEVMTHTPQTPQQIAVTKAKKASSDRDWANIKRIQLSTCGDSMTLTKLKMKIDDLRDAGYSNNSIANLQYTYNQVEQKYRNCTYAVKTTYFNQ